MKTRLLKPLALTILTVLLGIVSVMGADKRRGAPGRTGD